MDGWGIKMRRQEGEGAGEGRGGVDCEQAFSCVSSHLQHHGRQIRRGP